MSNVPTAPTRQSRRHTKEAERAAFTRRWASIQDTAQYLSVTTRTVRQMVSDGRLIAYRSGARLVRLDLNEVDSAMQPFGGAA